MFGSRLKQWVPYQQPLLFFPGASKVNCELDFCTVSTQLPNSFKMDQHVCNFGFYFDLDDLGCVPNWVIIGGIAGGAVAFVILACIICCCACGCCCFRKRRPGVMIATNPGYPELTLGQSSYPPQTGGYAADNSNLVI